VELCADATGLQFQRDDADRFIGFRSSGTDGVSTEKDPSIRVWGTPGDVESIMLGTRSGSAVSLIIYAKDVEIAREKDGDGSTYDAIHRAHGWDGEAPRTRIEWRINGVGLTLTQWQTGEVIDLRDPWLLGQPETLSQLWAAVAEKRRLIVPTRTRNTRSETDPRWAFVQSAALEEHRTGSENWRQARFVESDTHDRRVERATRDAIRALHRVAQLHDRSVHVAGGLPAVAERLGDLNPAALKDGIGYGYTYGFLQRNILKDEIERAGRDNWPARKRKAK
jgi:hypothetical protein